MSDLKNIRKLLSADKDLPLVEKGLNSRAAAYPAYDKMLENAKNAYIDEKQVPEFMSRFNQRLQLSDGQSVPLADTNSKQSMPSVLDNLLGKNPDIDKEFLNKLQQRRMLLDSTNKYDSSIDRTAVNDQIIEAYLKDKNPTLIHNLGLAKKEKSSDRYALENDNSAHLFSEAKKLIGDVGTNPEFAPQRDIKTDKNQKLQGGFSSKENFIVHDPSEQVDMNNLGYKTSVPFHELLHSLNVKDDINEYGAENTNIDFSNSNKISKDIIRAQNSVDKSGQERSHLNFPAKGNVYESGAINSGDNTGESGVYFNRLMKLIGKPIK